MSLSPASGPAVPGNAPADPTERLVVCWRMVRRCSLTPRQMLISFSAIVALYGLISGVSGWYGYWAIALCCVLQLLLIAMMYLHHLVHAVDGELVRLFPEGQVVIHVTRGFHTLQHVMPVTWIRVERGGPGTLWLCCKQLRVEVGTRLRPSERLQVERELKRCFEGMRALPALGTTDATAATRKPSPVLVARDGSVNA
ncbi:MAG: putative transrane protein [Polaromonas sp.]|nr:putative transrane protein [Polaromonas sp.]